MDFELPSNRGRTSPGLALAATAIIAAGVTGMAVAGLTWALERPAGTPPDVAAIGPSPSPSVTAPIDTPGWAEALGLPAPAPVTSGGDAVPTGGAGPAAQPAVPGTEEATRRAAAARRPVGPATAATRSTATNAAAAPVPTAPPSSTDPGVPDPGLSDPGATEPGVADPGAADPGASDPGASVPGATDPGVLDPGASDPGASDPGVLGPGLADPGTTDPGTTDAGATGPGAGDPGTGDPTATETTAPNRRNWEGPRHQRRDQEPAGPAPWNRPFGDFPRLFPWG